MIADTMAQFSVLKLGQQLCLDCLEVMAVQKLWLFKKKVQQKCSWTMFWYIARSRQNTFQWFRGFSIAIYRGLSPKQQIVKRFFKLISQKKSCPQICFFASEIALISLAKKRFCSASCGYLKSKKKYLKQNVNLIKRVGKNRVFLGLEICVCHTQSDRQSVLVCVCI